MKVIRQSMKKILIFVFFFIFGILNFCFAQATPSQIERMEEVLREQEALRKKIEEPEKIYIKKIIIEGVTLLSESEIKDIIAPFQKRWLTKEDIREILELIKQVYKEKGYSEELIKISYRVIKNRQLKIKVEELMKREEWNE